MQTDRTFERSKIAVGRFQVHVVPLVAEYRGRNAGIEFGVFVIGFTGLELQRTDRSAQLAHFAGDIPATALHVDADRRFCHRAVSRIETGTGNTDVAVGPGLRNAKGTAV